MEKYVNKYCKYCAKEPVLNFEEVLKCSNCDKIIHIKCLKRQTVPGGLYGDTFYNLICQDCSETNTEVFVREKMTWFQIIILIMYHFEYKTAGIGKKGFFHWRIHLVNFIEAKWHLIFPKNFERKKNWRGTIAGALSHFSPWFFTSGSAILGSSGWWKLTFRDLTPTATTLIYNDIIANKDCTLKQFSDIIYIKNMICKYVPKLLSIQDSSYYKVIHEREEEKINKFIKEINIDLDDELELLSSGELFESPSNSIMHHDIEINEVFNNISPVIPKKNKIQGKTMKEIHFKKYANTHFYRLWRKHKKNIEQKTNNVIFLHSLEENVMNKYISKKNCNNRFELALKRKLHVRYLKLERDLRILNIDKRKIINMYLFHERFLINKKNEEVRAGETIEKSQLLSSPYTDRLLQPYVRRDLNPKSVWLQLMQELIEKVSEKKKIVIHWSIASLDYVYIQADHVPAVNSLCQKYFWPDIDLSEALLFPDFSCVVLYRRLVVGFGFMVPDIKINEVYISFLFIRPEWRRNGIATFILYHLIHTCAGKDILLHVAIDNPAIHLYQKFGFKVEKVVNNFYDCYYEEGSKQCGHAFLLKLEK